VLNYDFLDELRKEPSYGTLRQDTTIQYI